jgi:UDP-3-O-[3-hydroxymyristoyl] glucosamine N-acyltransferase
MVANHFFKKKGPFPLREIAKIISCIDNISKEKNKKIFGIGSLSSAGVNDITFLNSSKYKSKSLNTKAGACITSSNLFQFLPDKCIKLNVKNVLFEVTQASKMFFHQLT